MVVRTVYVKLFDKDRSAERIAALRTASERELAAVPGVRSVATLTPADEAAEAAWDLLLLVRFDDIADVEPYKVHQRHLDYLNNHLNPVAEVKKAWNFSGSGFPV